MCNKVASPEEQTSSSEGHLQRDFKRVCSRTECQTPRATAELREEEEEHCEQAIDSDPQQHSQYLNVEDSQQNLNVTEDTYSLFRNKYLVSNVVNSKPETSRPLHSYKLKVQGTTIELGCLTQVHK